jgi:outer membrane protein assembly factor BamE (lipoprotein component of BamABCDE complex)
MLRTPAVIAALATSLLGAAACVPTNSFQGFQVIDQSPTDVKVGEDRSAVLAKLGSPTATATFDKNTWFYMTQVSNKTAFYRPRVVRRSVTAIDFDKGAQTVTAINTFTLKDGRVIAYNGRETPTRGREMSILEQLVGSIGTASVLPQDQNVSPGDHPDSPR